MSFFEKLSMDNKIKLLVGLCLALAICMFILGSESQKMQLKDKAIDEFLLEYCPDRVTYHLSCEKNNPEDIEQLVFNQNS